MITKWTTYLVKLGIRDLVLDDYHESMDQQRFEQWFQKFVQNVPDKSAIVLPIAT